MRTLSRGVVLPVALILMAVMAVSALAVFRTSLVAGTFGNNQRLQHLAFQAAETALAHCESKIGRVDERGEAMVPVLPASGAGDVEPRRWASLVNWQAPTSMALDVALDLSNPPDANAGASAQAGAQCLVEEIALPGSDSSTGNSASPFHQVTARGWVAGAQVWLQSVVQHQKPDAWPGSPDGSSNPQILLRSRAVLHRPQANTVSAGATSSRSATVSARRVEAVDREHPMPWDFDATSDEALGAAIVNVETGLMRNGRQAVLFGNGMGGAGGIARLYILDLATGLLMRQIDTHPGPANGLTGLRAVRNAEGHIVAIYAGDLLGHLWRFDLSSVTPSQWHVALEGKPLFTAVDDEGVPQAFVAPPEVAPHPQGGFLAVGGTALPPGMSPGAATASIAQQQALYGIWDRSRLGAAANASAAEVAPVERGQLATHTLAPLPGSGFETVVAQKIDWKKHRGWRLPLPPGVSDTRGPGFVRGVVRFRLSTPDSLESIELQLDPLTGGMTQEPLFDTNGDGLVDAFDATVAGVRVRAGEGPAVNAHGKSQLKTPSGRTVLVDPGEFRPGRSWRQIVNFPR
jgi:Tfp pilus assembly protein PilX